MNKSLSQTDDFSARIETKLREHGVYPTIQRLAIAKFLFAKNQHVTADQVYLLLSNAGFRVSRATVYNTLNTFVQSGLLNEIYTDSGNTYFDSNTSHHHHLYNIDTTELIDITDNIEPCFDQNLLPENTCLDSVDIVIRVRNSSS